MQREMKKAEVAILISDKIDFKTKAITKDKGGRCMILKGLIQQENIMHVYIYACNTGAPKYIRKILVDFNGDIVSSTIIVGDCNTPLSSMNRLSRQKKNQHGSSSLK